MPRTPIDVSFTLIGFSLGAILGLGGVILLLAGTITGNGSATSFGLVLVVIAVITSFLSFLRRDYL